jgi:hypothetical protein
VGGEIQFLPEKQLFCRVALETVLSYLPPMSDMFILLGHLLTTIAKLMRPCMARASVGGCSNCPWLRD